MTKTDLEFGISVIVICLIFVIWNFHSSIAPQQFALFTVTAIELWLELRDENKSQIPMI
jgi:hypothetical protein